MLPLLLPGSNSDNGRPTTDQTQVLVIAAWGLAEPTAELIVITQTSAYSDENGIIDKQFDHDPLATFTQQRQQLWPRLPLEVRYMMILM